MVRYLLGEQGYRTYHLEGQSSLSLWDPWQRDVESAGFKQCVTHSMKYHQIFTESLDSLQTESGKPELGVGSHHLNSNINRTRLTSSVLIPTADLATLFS